MSKDEASSELTVAYRYVRWHDVWARMSQGYAFDCDLGPPHNHYSCLMIFLCSCGREAP